MRRRLTGPLLVILSLVTACQGLGPARRPTATFSQTATAPQLLPSPTPLPSATPIIPDSGWHVLRPGLEERVLNILDDDGGDAADATEAAQVSADGTWLESITVLRLEPHAFRFKVAYQPGQPQSLSAWQDESGALLVVNAGFFSEEDTALGLVVSDGQVSGSSFRGFGGMFGVTARGPFLRSLTQVPYRQGEPLLQAVQSFPMLVARGGVAAISEEDGQRARRTVVAQDRSGRILFLVAAHGHFTLYGLSHYLAASDLELDRALNLDGGKSSGFLLADPRLHIPAFTILPAVITIRTR